MSSLLVLHYMPNRAEDAHLDKHYMTEAHYFLHNNLEGKPFDTICLGYHWDLRTGQQRGTPQELYDVLVRRNFDVLLIHPWKFHDPRDAAACIFAARKLDLRTLIPELGIDSHTAGHWWELVACSLLSYWKNQESFPWLSTTTS